MITYAGAFNYYATAAHVYAWRKSIIKIMHQTLFWGGAEFENDFQ